MIYSKQSNSTPIIQKKKKLKHEKGTRIISRIDKYNLAYVHPFDYIFRDPELTADTDARDSDILLLGAALFCAALLAALLAVRGRRVGRGGFGVGVSVCGVGQMWRDDW